MEETFSKKSGLIEAPLEILQTIISQGGISFTYNLRFVSKYFYSVLEKYTCHDVMHFCIKEENKEFLDTILKTKSMCDECGFLCGLMGNFSHTEKDVFTHIVLGITVANNYSRDNSNYDCLFHTAYRDCKINKLKVLHWFVMNNIGRKKFLEIFHFLREMFAYTAYCEEKHYLEEIVERCNNIEYLDDILPYSIVCHLICNGKNKVLYRAYTEICVKLFGGQINGWLGKILNSEMLPCIQDILRDDQIRDRILINSEGFRFSIRSENKELLRRVGWTNCERGRKFLE